MPNSPGNPFVDYSLARLFAERALVYPDNKALYINQHYYTYGELLAMANTIYQCIQAEAPFTRIGIYCTASVFSYAALLAVSLYGAAWVPLHPLFPPARNKQVIEDAALQLVLTETEWPEELRVASCQALQVPPLSKTAKQHNIIPVEKCTTPECYVLYTSGSSGIPKGVPVSKKNVQAFFAYFLNEYDFSPEDRFLQTYELSFDVSVFSTFMPWLIGACTYVVSDTGIKYLNILKLLKEKEITVCSMVPGVLRYIEKYLPELKLPALRFSFFSGDALLHQLAVKWKTCMPNARIHNFYGPTETTIVCTRYVWEEEASAREAVHDVVPLGKAFPGMEYILVDETHSEVQAGKIGHLCFSGAQVIEAYLNGVGEEMFFARNNKRYYKTGDLASVNAAGNLVFHGRSDTQVKINGYRVELGEVEARIKELCQANCCVMTIDSGQGIKALVAFMEVEANTEMLKKSLQKVLPEYMVPQQYIYVSSWPLTINGKTDRQQLKQFLYV